MRRIVLLTGVLAVLGVACEHGSPTAPTPMNMAPASLSDGVRLAMEQALGDEYQAETTYQRVVDEFGSYLPFVNVLSAEQRHSASIAGLFANRGLSVPPNMCTPMQMPHYESIAAACAAAAEAERANIGLYDRFLAMDLPADVRQVFMNNRAASLYAHLPAFERCAP